MIYQITHTHTKKEWKKVQVSPSENIFKKVLDYIDNLWIKILIKIICCTAAIPWLSVHLFVLLRAASFQACPRQWFWKSKSRDFSFYNQSFAALEIVLAQKEEGAGDDTCFKCRLQITALSVERWDNQGHLEKRCIEEGYQWSEKSDWISACFPSTPPGQEARRHRVVAAC